MNKVYNKKYDLFLKLIYQARMGLNLRQVDLAEQLKVPQSFISKMESGERRIDIVELSEICLVLGITLTEFIKSFEQQLNEAKL